MAASKKLPGAASFLSRPLTLLLLLLLAFFLRTYLLDRQALRGDEAATVLYAAMPISELWELSRVTDPHPPLYYLSLHPWQWLVGESAWAMRFAGVLASTLSVAALYRLARQTLDNKTPGSNTLALLAAALLAANPLQIWLAQDVRSYPFFTLLGLLSSWTLWAALHHRHKQYPSTFLRWLLYILLTTVSFYIHYYTALLILFQGLFVLLNIRKFWPDRWQWLASQLAIGLLMIPGLMLAYNFIGQAAGGIEEIAAPDLLRLASTALLTGFTIEDRWGLWLSLLLLPVWIGGGLSLLRRDWTAGSFWTLFFAAPVLGVIILSLDRPFFKERFLIQAQPAFELLLAAGFIALWRLGQGWPAFLSRRISAPSGLGRGKMSAYLTRLAAIAGAAFLLLANVLALGNYFANPAYAKAPAWHLYHDYVRQKFQPHDVMLTNFPEAAVSYYSPAGLPFYVAPVERDRPVEFRVAETEKIAGAYQRIWFLPLLRQGFDEQGDVLNWLDRHADRVDQIFFPDYHLNLYLSPALIETMIIEQPAHFAHGQQLRGFQIFNEQGKSRLTPPNEMADEHLLTLEPEDSFTLSLYWLADGPTSESYTVFVHLIAPDGFNRTGQDNIPVWGSYPTTHWSPGEKITDKYTLTVPPGTPPGDHRLRIGWYNSETLARLPVLAEAGQPTADYVGLNVIIRVEQR